MKKKLVATLTMIVMLTAVFLCVGCEENEENPPIMRWSPTDFSGCVLDDTGYDVDDVTFEVYFGSLFGSTGDAEKDIAKLEENGRGYEYAEIYFINHEKTEKEDWYLIRRIDDYTSVEYCCSKVGAKNLQKAAFNHHESVKIPKELLIGDSGKIGFGVLAKPYNRSTPEIDFPMRRLSGCVISYKIVDGKVLLSSNSIMRD